MSERESGQSFHAEGVRATNQPITFTVRDMLGGVFVFALLLAVCTFWELGYVTIAIPAIAFMCDVILRLRFGSRDGRNIVRGIVVRAVSAVGVFSGGLVTWLVANRYLLHEDAGAMFNVSPAGILVFAVFGIPAAILGFHVIACPPLHWVARHSRSLFSHVVCCSPMIITLICTATLILMRGAPGNLLTWLLIFGTLFWTLLLPLGVGGWVARFPSLVAPIVIMFFLIEPTYLAIQSSLWQRYAAVNHLTDVAGCRTASWYPTGVLFSKCGRNCEIIELYFENIQPDWRLAYGSTDQYRWVGDEGLIVNDIDLKKYLQPLQSPAARRQVITCLTDSSNVARRLQLVQLMSLKRNGDANRRSAETWWSEQRSTYRIIRKPEADVSHFDESLLPLDTVSLALANPISSEWDMNEEHFFQRNIGILFDTGQQPIPFRSKETGRYGVAKRGKIIKDSAYLSAGRRFREGRLNVYIDGGWGYINTHAQTVIHPRFERATEFSEGIAAVMLDGKYGFIDRYGAWVIKPRFDDVLLRSFSEGLCGVKVGDQWGYVNRHGIIEIAPKFQSCSVFSEGLAAVRVGDRAGYIDQFGNFVIDTQFYSAGEFRNGRARVDFHQDGPLYLINRQGIVVESLGFLSFS